MKKSLKKNAANAITDSILPLLTPDIEIQSSRGKELLIIRVPHGVGPYVPLGFKTPNPNSEPVP